MITLSSLKRSVFNTEFLVLLLMLSAFASQNIKLMVVSLIFIFSHAVLIASNKGLTRDFQIFFCMFFVVLFIGGLKLDHGFNFFFYYITELFLIFYAILFSKNLNLLYSALKNVLTIFSMFIFVSICLNWGSHEPLSHIIPGSSQNGIPSYLLVVTISFLSLQYLLFDKMSMIPAFFVFWVSYLGEGRGSMVISILLLISVVGISFLPIKLKTVLVTALFSIPIGVYLLDFYSFIISGTKLSVGLEDSHRINILIDYLNSLDLWGTIVGKGYEGTIIESVYNNNPHVAYIRFHSFFGILALIFLLLFPFLLILKKITWKNIFLSWLIFLMMLRALSEPILFPTFLDVFFFSTVFSIYEYNKLMKPVGFQRS